MPPLPFSTRTNVEFPTVRVPSHLADEMIKGAPIAFRQPSDESAFGVDFAAGHIVVEAHVVVAEACLVKVGSHGHAEAARCGRSILGTRRPRYPSTHALSGPAVAARALKGEGSEGCVNDGNIRHPNIEPLRNGPIEHVHKFHVRRPVILAEPPEEFPIDIDYARNERSRARSIGNHANRNSAVIPGTAEPAVHAPHDTTRERLVSTPVTPVSDDGKRPTGAFKCDPFHCSKSHASRHPRMIHIGTFKNLSIPVFKAQHS